MEGRITIKYLANKVEIYRNLEINAGILTYFNYFIKRTYDLFKLHSIVKHTL